MQLPPDEQEFIRRAFHVEGKAIRQIERETGHSRQAIRRAICAQARPLSSIPICSHLCTTVALLSAEEEVSPPRKTHQANGYVR